MPQDFGEFMQSRQGTAPPTDFGEFMAQKQSGPPGIPKPPLPAALQGPPPGIAERALTNLPRSVLNLPMLPAPPGSPSMRVDPKTGKMDAPGTVFDPNYSLGEDVAAPFSSLIDRLSNPGESIAEDPAGSALGLLGLIRGVRSPKTAAMGKQAASEVRPLLTNWNITHPLKMAPDVFDAAGRIIKAGGTPPPNPADHPSPVWSRTTPPPEEVPPPPAYNRSVGVGTPKAPQSATPEPAPAPVGPPSGVPAKLWEKLSPEHREELRGKLEVPPPPGAPPTAGPRTVTNTEWNEADPRNIAKDVVHWNAQLKNEKMANFYVNQHGAEAAAKLESLPDTELIQHLKQNGFDAPRKNAGSTQSMQRPLSQVRADIKREIQTRLRLTPPPGQ